MKKHSIVIARWRKYIYPGDYFDVIGQFKISFLFVKLNSTIMIRKDKK